MTTGTVLETYGITDIGPPKTPAEVRPAQIVEDPVLSTEAIALFTSATEYFSSLNRYPTIELHYSEDAGKEDDFMADVDADLAGLCGNGIFYDGSRCALGRTACRLRIAEL